MAAGGEEETDSFKTFIEKHSDKPEHKELCEQWENMCTSLQIESIVRWKMDTWFQKCHRAWKDVQILTQDVSCEMALSRKEELFWNFLEEFDALIKSEPDMFLRKFKFTPFRDEIRRLYQSSPEMWVDLAVQCVEKENEIVANFKKVKLEKEKAEANKKVERKLNMTKQKRKQFEMCVTKLKNERQTLMRYRNEKEEKEEQLSNLEAFMLQKGKNGVTVENVKLRNEIQQFYTEIEKTMKNLLKFKEEVSEELQKLRNGLFELVEELLLRVQEWKDEFKFQYADLEASPNLEQVAPQCAQVGRLVHDLIHIDTVQWEDELGNLEWTEEQENLQQIRRELYQLLIHFIQCTFVVTEQESCIIKVDRKHLPKIVVRILAADSLPNHAGEVQAEFMSEDDINDCYHDNYFDLELVRNFPRLVSLKTNRVHFVAGSKKDRCEACFQSLQFNSKFCRPSNQTGRQVHEEKFRIVFTTCFPDLQSSVWTLSLPLVVTTGANQGCLSQASVMWQCFSTDVYTVPIQMKNELHWCEVANMLQAKIRKLHPAKSLSDENIRHLKRRLLGSPDKPDETLVSLKKFCFDKLEKPDNTEDFLPFSFWKWFTGIYNLLEKYLLNFWKDGLIEGFISKEDAKEKLKHCPNRSGTFILRFSDQNITDSQGVKSLFGHLTACVLIIKEDTDGRKKKKIYDMDVAGHKKLKEKNLANVLKETQETKSGKIYQYLYPGDRTREDLFDKYCAEAAIVPGYRGTRDAFVVDLDQAIAALEIDSGKHRRSPSIDSGVPDSPVSAATVKRPRPSVENPTLVRILQSSHHGPSNFSTPQASPAPSGSLMSPYPCAPSPASTVFMSPPHPSTCGHFINPGTVNSSPPDSLNSAKYQPLSVVENQSRADSLSRQMGTKQPSSLPPLTAVNDQVSMATTVGVNRSISSPAGSCYAQNMDHCGAAVSHTNNSNETMCFIVENGTLQATGSGGIPMVCQEAEEVIVLTSDENSQETVSQQDVINQMLTCGTAACQNNQNSQTDALSDIIAKLREVTGLPLNEQAVILLAQLVAQQSLQQQQQQQQQFQLVVSSAAMPPSEETVRPSTSQVAMDSNPSLSSGRTSSGSLSGLMISNQEFEANQEVNSGNIDLSVFDETVNTSSGGIAISSFRNSSS